MTTRQLDRPTRSVAARADDEDPTEGELRPATSWATRAARRARGPLIVVTALVALATLTAVLFLTPVRSWMRQGEDLPRRAQELDELRDANAGLEAEIARLETNGGIVQSIREQLGYVRPGEQLFTEEDPTEASMSLPTGWPFDTVGAILRLRGAPAPTP